MPTVSDLRESFIDARENLQKAQLFYQTLKKITEKTPLFEAYRIATDAFKAKYAFTPWEKYTLLLSIQSNLKKIIREAPENIEIRFIRFSIEHHTPIFLGMSQHLNLDKQKIIDNFWLPEVEEELQNMIRKFLMESGRCTSNEIAKIQDKTV